MTKINIFRDYPRTFWIANVMELFERAAYYGLNSVLAGFLTLSVAEGGLGFKTQSVGFLQGIVYACTYVLPILGGALADRYGYRRILLIPFSLLATGYFAAGYASGYALVFLALLWLAFLIMGLTAQPIQYRTVVQALIFLSLGAGGLWINRHGAARAAQAAG